MQRRRVKNAQMVVAFGGLASLLVAALVDGALAAGVACVAGGMAVGALGWRISHAPRVSNVAARLRHAAVLGGHALVAPRGRPTKEW